MNVMIPEKNENLFYKDIRFWLVLASMLTLAVLMLRSYPVLNH